MRSREVKLMKNIKIEELIKQKILVLDGAMGTFFQKLDLKVEDFGSEDYVGCYEYLVVSNPDVVTAAHEEYLAAGADIIETNTFGGTSVVLADFGLQDKVQELNREAVKLARKACDKFATTSKPRFVAGSMGPTSKSLSITGGISFENLSGAYEAQAYALTDAGVDYLLLETVMDTLNLKAAYVGIQRAFERLKCKVPIAVSVTIERSGTMLAGQDIETFYTSIEYMNPLYVGMNCSVGPDLMKADIQRLSKISNYPISIVPNAGLPDENGNYLTKPEIFVDLVKEFIEERLINVVGGCCGTSSEHISLLNECISVEKIRIVPEVFQSRISGIDSLVLEDELSPYYVGERCNVIGSRAFKRLISEEKFEEASEVGRRQKKAGAHIIDICVSNPDRNEVEDMKQFLSFITRIIKAPIMVDSQSREAVEAAFKRIQGKCVLNSVNLEEGGKLVKELVPLVRYYGAAVVVGCIDDEMAVTADKKLEVARKAYNILTKEYGILPQDIIFDPLVFPCATGDEKYIGSAKETIEGVRLIKKAFPRCKVLLGVSNVSFGLPLAGREVLNKVFIQHAVKAGLDLAIVNTEKLLELPELTKEEIVLCDNLLFHTKETLNDAINPFVEYFREKKIVKTGVIKQNLTIEESLINNIEEGSKENLAMYIQEALKKWDPIELINGPLMKGMDNVGEKFKKNEVIVAEVLQSAEVMKTAVSFLEPYMNKKELHKKGILLLATVKGDVHDIGKNLVKIILSNNGFEVIDIGIKCSSDDIVQASKKYMPDFIGLSGLLVKSAHEMINTAIVLKENDISVPLLVGGAALTEKFVATKIAPEYNGPVVYCRDAMESFDVANKVTKKQGYDDWVNGLRAQQKILQDSMGVMNKGVSSFESNDYQSEEMEIKAMAAPHYEKRVVAGDLKNIFSKLSNEKLFRHLGEKKYIAKITDGDDKLLLMLEKVDKLKEDILKEDLVQCKGIYSFYKVKRKGDSIIILDSVSEKAIEQFSFPRKKKGKVSCLSDYISENNVDTISIFVVSGGLGIGDNVVKLNNETEYLKAHMLSVLALESTEIFAEILHGKINEEWLGADYDKDKKKGPRVSLGYPMCPNLEDQKKIWKLLKPDERIGVTLTSDNMMVPEASISAIVFH
jgi:5-methyltetrahydrofolate--homocysteine methyltransferase